MARRFLAIVSLLALGLLPALAQDNAAPTSGPPNRPGGPSPGEGMKGNRPENARRMLEKRTPEERQRLRQNLQRWNKMPPAEKDQLRDFDQMRREKMQQDIDAAIRQSDLQLDPDRREVYALRYKQERRRLEERLRREMEEKRRPALEEITARLKAEFQAKSSPSPTP